MQIADQRRYFTVSSDPTGQAQLYRTRFFCTLNATLGDLTNALHSSTLAAQGPNLPSNRGRRQPYFWADLVTLECAEYVVSQNMQMEPAFN